VFAPDFETNHLSSFFLEPRQRIYFGFPNTACLSVCAGPPAGTPRTYRGPSGLSRAETPASFRPCPAFVIGRPSVCICLTARFAIRPFLSSKVGPQIGFGLACCSKHLCLVFRKSVLALNFVDFPVFICYFEMKDYFHSLSFLRIN
jgi:hypothetical protein